MVETPIHRWPRSFHLIATKAVVVVIKHQTEVARSIRAIGFKMPEMRHFLTFQPTYHLAINNGATWWQLVRQLALK